VLISYCKMPIKDSFEFWRTL